MGSLKKAVKKVAKPEIILPLALIAATGGLGAGAAGVGTGAGAGAGAAAAGTGAASGAASKGIMANLFGTAGSTAATGATTAGKTARAMNLLKAGTTTFPATSGVVGTAGAFAPLKGTLAKGAMYGLKNPLTKQGLATYGGGLGALSLLMGKDKTEEQKNLNTDPQAVYDMGRLMNKQAGGLYTDEELNTYMAPLLSQYGGKYQIADPAPERKRRMMFPGLNYSGLTRYAADGGRIHASNGLFVDPEMDADGFEIPRDPKEMGIGSMALEAIGNLIRGAEMEDDGYSFPRRPNKIRKKIYDMLGFDPSNYPGFDDLTEIYGAQEEDSFAYGGSVPQTESIPQGMQIDGRGGGFIPMGAKEKHDDVPAMLAKNEFVMTSDAVKGAGGGSINKGAQRMYDLMHSLESKV